MAETVRKWQTAGTIENYEELSDRTFWWINLSIYLSNYQWGNFSNDVHFNLASCPVVNLRSVKYMESSQVKHYSSEIWWVYTRYIWMEGVGDNLILCMECLRWVHKRCSGISGKLKSNVDFHYRRCLEGVNGLFKSKIAGRGCGWAQYGVGMCSQVLLFGWHTWCGRCGGGGKSQSEMCNNSDAILMSVEPPPLSHVSHD